VARRSTWGHRGRPTGTFRLISRYTTEVLHLRHLTYYSLFFIGKNCYKEGYTLLSNIFEDCNRLSGTAVSFDDLGDTIMPHPLFCYAQGRAGQSDYLTWGVLFHGSNYMPTTLFRAWHTPYLFPPSAVHRVESVPITSTTATQLQEDGAATILSSMSAQSPRLTPVPSHARS